MMEPRKTLTNEDKLDIFNDIEKIVVERILEKENKFFLSFGMLMKIKEVLILYKGKLPVKVYKELIQDINYVVN